MKFWAHKLCKYFVIAYRKGCIVSLCLTIWDLDMLSFITLHVAITTSESGLVVGLYSVLHTQHIPKSRFVLQHVENSLEGDPRLKLWQYL